MRTDRSEAVPRRAQARPACRVAERPSPRAATSAMALSVGAAATLALGGCAVVQVDAQGGHRVVGLVALSVPPPGCAAPGAEGLRVRSVGLTLTRGTLGDAFVLGYQDASVLSLRDDSLVLLGPPPASLRP